MPELGICIRFILNVRTSKQIGVGWHMKVEIYADGAVKDNGKPTAVAGWAYVILLDGEKVVEENGQMTTPEGAEYEDYQSNNTGELMAVIKGLEELPHPCSVTVYSDSAYVVNCFKERWYDGWRRRNWYKSDGTPVMNRLLWERLLAQHERHDVTWVHVKGHDGVYWNEYCDRLAKQAIFGKLTKSAWGGWRHKFGKLVPLYKREEPKVLLMEDEADEPAW